MNVRCELEDRPGDNNIRLNDVDIDPERIRAIMINEVVPEDPTQDFYGSSGELYLSTTLALFRQAGIYVEGIDGITDLGIYITNAVKTPKNSYTVEKQSFESSLPYLEKELSLFPNVKVIMLMGDVAKKMFNQIARKRVKRNPIPSSATYKLRSLPYYYGDIRVIPSYIMTGGNILIEKSKAKMVAEDIAVMAEIIK